MINHKHFFYGFVLSAFLISYLLLTITNRQSEVIKHLENETNVQAYTIDSIIMNNSGDCVCFNCNKHKWGYIPPITMFQLESNAKYWLMDMPEEPINLGDTISMKNIGDSLFIGFFHKKYPISFYSGCDIYIISDQPE